MHIPLPLFVVRRMVRKNPWLLLDNGSVSRQRVVRTAILDVELSTRMRLTPYQRKRLQAEVDAGTLFTKDQT